MEDITETSVAVKVVRPVGRSILTATPTLRVNQVLPVTGRLPAARVITNRQLEEFI